MTKYNANNERIKRKYFGFLKEAKCHSEPTVDASAKALNRFEIDTNYREVGPEKSGVTYVRT